MNKYITEEEKNKIMAHIVGAGYNISSLASEIGMTRESLSSRVNGKVDFGKKEMEKIAACLGKKPADIFF